MTLFFDLDDTILDHRFAERSALEKVYNRNRAVFHTVSLEDYLRSYATWGEYLWNEYRAGRLSKNEVRYLRFQRVLRDFDKHEVHLTERYAIELSPQYLEYYPEFWKFIEDSTLEVLVELRKRGHSLALVTNGFRETQIRKIAALGLEKVFDNFIYADDVGALKPAGKFFTYALDEMKTTKEDAVMIGDSFNDDVEGAYEAGWKKIFWFRGEGSAKAESISSLKELLNVL